MKNDAKIEQLPDGVRIITPRHTLREKIGYGGIDPAVLTRAQDFIEETTVDFEPFATAFLERLQKEIQAARSKPNRNQSDIHAITRPVMELKANGGMFRYPLITEIADILLNFLESLSVLNDDAIDVAEIHYKTLTAIIASKLTGDGGREGRKLINELDGACQRYMKKHQSSANA
jgi:hypothetical protein